MVKGAIHCSIITWERSLHLSLTIGVGSNPLKYWRPPGYIVLQEMGCYKYNGSKRYDNTPNGIARAAARNSDQLDEVGLPCITEPPRNKVRMHKLLSDSKFE